MAFMLAHGECIGCKQLFSFNPNLVPSCPINGVREPICRNCVERVNPKRIANGLEPIRILENAYGPEEVA